MNQARLRPLSTVVLAFVVPVVVVIAVVVTLSATSSDTTADARSAAPGTAITIKNFAFAPTPLEAKSGTTITVSNEDGTAHTLTADDKSFDTGNLGGGAHGAITLGKPGTYAYHCEIHNYMTGTIKVT